MLTLKISDNISGSQDNLCSSSHRRRYKLESTSKEHLAGTDAEQTCMHNSRPLKDRRTEMDQTFQGQPGARSDNLFESLRKLHRRDTQQMYDQYGTDQSEVVDLDYSEFTSRPMTPV